MQDFIVPFLTVGLAEMGDKTQLAVFCLASRTRKRLALFLGVLLAFIITDGIAIALGNLISQLVPLGYVKVISGAVFVVFGIVTILTAKDEEMSCELSSPFLSGFGLVFISELGDKTQIATGLFATQYRPLPVFAGVIAALGILSLVAIYLGRYVVSKLDSRKVSILAGVLFVLVGISAFL